MTLSDTARAHVKQCHRKDRSEELLLKLADALDKCRAELSYTYTGKDGKPVLARDLEDERDALRAELADLRDQFDRLREDRNGIIANVPSAAREG